MNEGGGTHEKTEPRKPPSRTTSHRRWSASACQADRAGAASDACRTDERAERSVASVRARREVGGEREEYQETMPGERGGRE